VNGYKTLRDVILIDQALLERTSRSVPATYLKVFDEIRGLFAKTVQARRRGLRPAHFSFNIVGGRCDTCNGSGKQTIDMQFLADVDLPCEDCEGRRFRSETLDIAYRGKNIWEVLEMTVDEALRFFADSPRIVTRLSVLVAVGLGYIRLGQPATQLSGGEAQRLKLALHISDTQTKNTLFLFDEPTTGLHFDDIKKLLRTFDRLVEKGATLIVIEHNLDVIKCADWIIDLGPEGGDGGGHVVAKGTPEKVAVCAESHTARYLREALA
jgi:excinuclease ABC subunit A